MSHFVSRIAPVLLQHALLLTGGIFLGRHLSGASDLPLVLSIALIGAGLAVFALNTRANNKRLAKLQTGTR